MNNSSNGSVGVPARRVSGAAAVSNPNPMAGALGQLAQIPEFRSKV